MTAVHINDDDEATEPFNKGVTPDLEHSTAPVLGAAYNYIVACSMGNFFVADGGPRVFVV